MPSRQLKPQLALLAALASASGLAAVVLPAEATAVTQTISARADAYTLKDAPRQNTGDATRVSTDGRTTTTRRTYLKVALPATQSGSTVSKVVLSLSTATDLPASGGPVAFKSSADWTESGITWRTQPSLGARVDGPPGAHAAGTWAEWDLTSAFTATQLRTGGTFSFALTSAATERLELRSQESGTGPHVTVTTLLDATPGSTEAAVIRGWGSAVAGDEFAYVGAPDPLKWGVYNSLGHAGKGLRSPTAWNVDSGVATVTGDELGTTGGMSAKFDRRKYGRWEVRMRTSARDPEYHPVLILWPDGDRSTCPEIDFAEGTSDTTKIKFFLHHACSGTTSPFQTTAAMTINTTEWHNYAVEWTPAAIVGYIDGIEWFRDADPAHQPPGPMHQTIQLDWFPDGTTLNRSWLQVDWVRVYDLG